MGTNYYLHRKPDCQCCSRPFEPIHIGKSSGGWCFSLHAIPQDSINDLDDWRLLWSQPGAFIRNEYDEVIPIATMEDIITNREWLAGKKRGFDYERNGAVKGPKGLCRHKLDGRYCVKHGAGTWDCITGEFS